MTIQGYHKGRQMCLADGARGICFCDESFFDTKANRNIWW